MRDTNYATELAPPAILTFPSGDEARLERLKIKETGATEIRLSWWKDGRMMMRPLDLSERDFVRLVAKAIRQGVLCPDDE